MGTLARAPLVGGAPREVLEQVQWADWAADGSGLVVVRNFGGRNRLEFPIENHSTKPAAGLAIRVSPLKETASRLLTSTYRVMTAARWPSSTMAGNKKTLSASGTQFKEWPGRRTAMKSGLRQASRVWIELCMQSRSKARSAWCLRLPGALMLFDIFKDGRVLMMRASWRRELIAMTADDAKQHDLRGWITPNPAGLSADGKMLLFDEEGGGGSLAYSKSGGLSYAVYIRKTDGSPAILLGAGGAVSLSPTENR